MAGESQATGSRLESPAAREMPLVNRLGGQQHKNGVKSIQKGKGNQIKTRTKVRSEE